MGLMYRGNSGKRLSPGKKFVFILLTHVLVVITAVISFEFGMRTAGYAWKQVYRIMEGDEGRFYLYSIGGSTTAGEPFEPVITFPKIISCMFNGRINDREIVVVNLAKGGCSIESSFWKLHRELFFHPERHGAVLIYSGVNDHVWKGDDPGFTRWKKMQRSIVLSRLQFCMEGRIGPENGFYSFLGLNNSLQKYEYRLRKTVDLAKRYSYPVIVSSLVGNLAGFDPEDNTIFKSAAAGQFQDARDLEKCGEYEKAIDMYAGMLLMNKVNPARVYYRLGKCYQALQLFDEAREYYWKAVDNGDVRRPNRWQNSVIERIAKECGIGFADPVKLFELNSPNGLAGYNLFMDAHHPNLAGYILIAQAFSRELENQLNVKPVAYNITEQELIDYFRITEEDLFRVYISRCVWHCVHSTFVQDKSLRVAMAEYFLEKAEKIDSDNPEVSLWHYTCALLRKNSEETCFWLNNGKLFAENSHVFIGKEWMKEVFEIPEEILDQRFAGMVSEP